VGVAVGGYICNTVRLVLLILRHASKKFDDALREALGNGLVFGRKNLPLAEHLSGPHAGNRRDDFLPLVSPPICASDEASAALAGAPVPIYLQ
jgi:hypothetical protein